MGCSRESGSMIPAEESPLSIEEMASRLKCSRGWVQLSVDAGCPRDGEGRISVQDFMLFQLSNIHRIRQIAGLEPIETRDTEEDLRPNVKAILSTQLEWLQARSTKDNVKQAARMVHQKIQKIEDRS